MKVSELEMQARRVTLAIGKWNEQHGFDFLLGPASGLKASAVIRRVGLGADGFFKQEQLQEAVDEMMAEKMESMWESS